MESWLLREWKLSSFSESHHVGGLSWIRRVQEFILKMSSSKQYASLYEMQTMTLFTIGIEIHFGLQSHAANISFYSGEVPTDIKVANTIKLFKKRREGEQSHNGPVSSMSAVWKKLQSIMKEVERCHLENMNTTWIYERKIMFAVSFFWGRGVVLGGIDKCEPADVVFLNFLKNFDKEPNRTLFNKIRAHITEGNKPGLRISYLTENSYFCVFAH